ncbi:Nucleoside-diphosphate-sugar epimerase [Paenibacillus uliginis N3/975]|uniref:Nucleoside-diphosphate-sugar epimerase n=1 Tax=Paenibacillus uliginis N3/975 TaxID=1313296 RepID=A0A1X7GR72_9BACL|nr:NAD(P)-dependent oxidoreductase [Paenibacillus uliginis]SMF73550.1 Nucleoside-diphosphate-sugar epimerase [Paenibacillus uliginis N3/975]
MKIFVAGATGVIGRLLLPALVQAGHEVIGMTHNKDRIDMIQSLGAQAVIADALDRDSIISTVASVQPEVIIHQLTSLNNWNVSDNARIREIGTRNLVDAGKAANVSRFIAQSISWAYEPGEGYASEEIPLDLNAPYPRKTTVDGIISLERAVAEISNHVILRYGMLYGRDTWYDRKGVIAEKVTTKQMQATEGITSFLHVEDAANAALLALDWPSGPINIVDDEPATGIEWLPVYAEALGAPKPNHNEGSNRGERGASNAKARIEYGWKPLYPTWRTGFYQSLSSE